MINICVDARMINNSGIGVYIRKYIECLLKESVFTIILIGRSKEIIQYFGSAGSWQHVEADIPIYSIQEQIKLPLLIPKCDIFWSPHYNIPLLPIRAKKRLVTIPDVFHLAHSETLSIAQKMYAKLVTNAAARKSDKVLTISKFSEKEIIRLTGTKRDKITTIYLGMDTKLYRKIKDDVIQKEVREKYKLPDRFILFVGNVKPNKNLRSLIAAFIELMDEIPDIQLLIAGKKDGFINGDPTLFSQIEGSHALSKRIMFSGYVAIEHLPVIYSMASVFAFPSLYEGFGFPPLEAMACGCPVVASNRASIPEICGDAALYIDPTNPTDLANGIKKVLVNDSYRDELIELGSHKVKEYRWLQSQEKFIQEIHELNSIS